MRRALAITVALFALIYVVARIRYAPPSPLPADVAVERFSAMRAREVQARLVGDGATRYVGTPGNARGRAVIVAELEKSGWTVETQTARACSYHGSCAPVANVVAQLQGREPALPGVLVTAHHDSVPVSPGASDDGLGTVTVLETARALSQGPRPRRTIVAVLTDAEEAGLLGADAFVRGHPLAGRVGATLNVDARGSHGPSQMFETSRGNEWLVALMADRLERPVTTSLFYEVYKRMPNDTDFSITKTIASGVNFANTAGMEHYHTPLDALDVSDPGTLQHHGDHVLSMTRALAESDLGGPGIEARGDSVWFDVLAFGIIHWPERWSMLLALLGLAMVVAQTFRARAFDRGLVVLLAVLVPGLAAAALVGWLLHAIGALPALFVAHPLPALTAIHAGTAAVALGIGLLVARRSTPRALWAGTWIGWGMLGGVTAAVAPGTSYLFIVPTLVAAICGSFSLAVASAAPAIAASVLLLALVSGIHDTLGFAVAAVTALPTLLLATTVVPLLVDLPVKLRRILPAALGALALGGALVAAIVPKFSAAAPQRV
ncbi:MAG: Peptidase, family, partial [Labilithrix sp.]|nr:Peptidase, family [Labilithrix sp.]